MLTDHEAWFKRIEGGRWPGEGKMLIFFAYNAILKFSKIPNNAQEVYL